MVARHRVASFSTVVVLAVLLLLLLSATALAADGVRVVPDTMTGGDMWQYGADVSGGFVAYCESPMPPSDVANIALKPLGTADPPYVFGDSFIVPGADFPAVKNIAPSMLAYDGKIYVVWTKLDLINWDSDVWIWQGTYDVAAGFTPDDGFPKVLVSGTVVNEDMSLIRHEQNAPSIGLVKVGSVDHVVVAWEDARDNGYNAPLVYMADLTSDSYYTDPGYVDSGAPGSAGWAVDMTDVLARGQHAPNVGSTGIYWLDDRWSFWNEGVLKDTAVWRARPVTDGWATGAFFSDVAHTYDNGFDVAPGGGPKAVAAGAVWLRCGAYGNPDTYQPFLKNGTASTVSPMVKPFALDAANGTTAGELGLAIMGAHLDRGDALDSDIYFYDPATRTRVAVCNVGNAAGATYESAPDYWRVQQLDPVISPMTGGGYRVLWTDNRPARAEAGEDSADSRLYQAFVPGVTLRSTKTTMLRLQTATLTAAVKPNFAGGKVTLQLVKPVRVSGAVKYSVVRALGTAKNLGLSSTASFTWKPTLKGTYYLRVSFSGGTKYYADGTTVEPSPGAVKVPHVANVSKTLKIVVK